MARSVFGESLKLDSVYVYACGWIMRGYAMSPNGHVYFNPHDWRADFAQANLVTQSWLIHELTHVWQVQQGIAVLRRALFDRRYRYVLEAGRAFLSYGVEQQAQMVQDYFLLKQRGGVCDAYTRCIPFLQPNDVDDPVS